MLLEIGLVFNKIASWGSYISPVSFIIFLILVCEAFYSNREAE